MMRLKTEHQSSSLWLEPFPPKRILIIRLHAIGDVALTLPFCAELRSLLPESRIDYLTLGSSSDFVRATGLFDSVHRFEAHDRWSMLGGTIRWGMSAPFRQYDVVVDLQRNWVSRAIRRSCLPRGWGEFDRYRQVSASERTLAAFQQAGFKDLRGGMSVPVPDALGKAARELLVAHGWDSLSPIALVNPAGLWPTRNWPLEHYRMLLRLMLSISAWQFAFLGTERIRERAISLKTEFGSRVIDLTGKTTLPEAMGIMKHVAIMITEDSGLMHLASSCGVRILALFGSTNYRWSMPYHHESITLHSGDLECGACMAEECRFGDVRCLTRYSPEQVLGKIYELIGRVPSGRVA